MSFRTFCRAEPTFPKSQENWEKEGDLNQDSVKNLKDLELTTKEIDLYFEEHPSRTDGNCFYHSMVDYIEGNDNDSIITIFETREYLQGWETQDSFEEEEMFMMHWLRKLVYQESLKSTTNELNGDAASESTTDFREKLKSGVEQTISDKNEYTDENENIVQTKSHGHVGKDLWTEDREIDVTARLLGIDICTLQKNGDEDQWVLSFHDPTGVELNGRVCFLKNNGNHFTNLTFKGEAESTAKLLEAARARRNARKVAKAKGAENGNWKKDTSKRSRNTENNIGSRKEAWSDFSDDFDDMTQKKLTSWIQEYNTDKHAWQQITKYSSMDKKELKDRIRKQIVFDKDETMFDLDRLNAMSRVQLKSWFKHSFYGKKIYGNEDEGFKDISEKTNQEIIPIIKGAILREACRNGSVAYVETLVDRKDIYINDGDIRGATPLYWACYKGHADVVRLLLDNKEIQINQGNEDGVTPLYLACQGNHVDVVNLLLDRKEIQINQANAKDGRTPLFATCELGHVDVVRLLLARPGIKINQAEESGATPLWITCAEGNVDLVQLLLARKEIQINQATKKGTTPLWIACAEGNVDVVRLLLARKEIKINQANAGGFTPLFVTCKNDHVDVVRLLLAQPRIKINQAANRGQTPLIVSSASGHVAVVRLLLARNAKVNKTQWQGATALDLAIQKGYSQIADILRRNGGRAFKYSE